MAKIIYTFSDGHTEEIEVTEEFKAAYEFELAREGAQYWKQYRQKERAGIPTGHDWSLDKMIEDGINFTSQSNPLEDILNRERKRELVEKILSCLTEKQRAVYVLYKKGFTQRQIAKRLHIALGSVNERLYNAKKNIFKFFSENPNI